jgi:hypothetical protein
MLIEAYIYYYSLTVSTPKKKGKKIPQKTLD